MLSEPKLYFILWGIFILQYLKSYRLRCNCLRSFWKIWICADLRVSSLTLLVHDSLLWYIYQWKGGGGIFCLFSPSHLPAVSCFSCPHPRGMSRRVGGWEMGGGVAGFANQAVCRCPRIEAGPGVFPFMRHPILPPFSASHSAQRYRIILYLEGCLISVNLAHFLSALPS